MPACQAGDPTGHAPDHGRRLLDPVQVGAMKQAAAEDHVHDDAGRDDQHPLADRLVLERPRVLVGLLVGVSPSPTILT